MLADCAQCGTRYAPDLAACPNCGSAEREGEMAKIITGVGPSYPEGHAPGDGEERVHPGEPFHAEILKIAAEGAQAESAVTAEPPAGPPVTLPPRVPPRRTPPPADA